MAGIKALIGLAFAGSIGMTLLILACAIPNSWWPFFNVIFYILTPLPTLIVQRIASQTSGSVNYLESAVFLTMGFVISAFALPIVMARAPGQVITMSACYLTTAGNIVIFLTLLGFFLVFPQDDGDFMW